MSGVFDLDLLELPRKLFTNKNITVFALAWRVGVKHNHLKKKENPTNRKCVIFRKLDLTINSRFHRPTSQIISNRRPGYWHIEIYIYIIHSCFRKQESTQGSSHFGSFPRSVSSGEMTFTYTLMQCSHFQLSFNQNPPTALKAWVSDMVQTRQKQRALLTRNES